MSTLMRCRYCGILQDEPSGAKACLRCGGELAFDAEPAPDERASYLQVQMELDQVKAPAGRNLERHVLITLRTPPQVPEDQRLVPQTGRPPLSFTAVLDVSGSMSGEKIIQATEAVRQALNRLQNEDYFSMVTFSSDVRCIIEPTQLNERARTAIASALKEISATGMTALDSGLQLGVEKASSHRQDTNLVLTLSDGQANVGETDLEKVGARAYRARQEGLTISTLGVGADYNEALMAEIATQGGGRFYHVQHPHQITAYLTGELGEMAALAARETNIHLNLPSGAAILPLSAAFPAQQTGNNASILVGDIPADLELEIPVRLTLPAQNPGVKLHLDGWISYRSPAGNAMKCSLNRVTVRFIEHPAFELRDGVVTPVVERVLVHMKASGILGVSRAMAMAPGTTSHRVQSDLESLREYASLLGAERAQAELQDAEIAFNAVQTAPAAAKFVVYDAHARQRSSRKFGKDDPKS